MTTIHWKQGTSLPFAQTTLSDASDAPIPLTGIRISTSIRDRLGTERFNAAVNVLDAVAGRVEIDWPVDFSLPVGEYWLDFVLLYPDDRVLRVPSGADSIHFLVWP